MVCGMSVTVVGIVTVEHIMCVVCISAVPNCSIGKLMEVPLVVI